MYIKECSKYIVTIALMLIYDCGRTLRNLYVLLKIFNSTNRLHTDIYTCVCNFICKSIFQCEFKDAKEITFMKYGLFVCYCIVWIFWPSMLDFIVRGTAIAMPVMVVTSHGIGEPHKGYIRQVWCLWGTF